MWSSSCAGPENLAIPLGDPASSGVPTHAWVSALRKHENAAYALTHAARHATLPVLALLFAATAGLASAAAAPAAPHASATPLVVGVASAPSSAALHAAGARRSALDGRARRYASPRPAGASAGVARRLRNLPGVRYVEPVFRYPPPRPCRTTPCCPASGSSSAHRRWAHQQPGAEARALRSPVAIVDTGVDLGHPDLAQNAWTNPGEMPGNGIDDDADGLVDDVHGWDFAGGRPDVSDADGHGTACRGRRRRARGQRHRRRRRSLARSHHGLEGDGLRRGRHRRRRRRGDRLRRRAPRSRRERQPQRGRPQRGDRGRGPLRRGPRRRRDRLGRQRPARPRRITVLSRLLSGGRLLAIGATDRSGAVAGFSNHGSAVDVYAPGDDILSTDARGEYGVRSGTSLAAPHVAGTLALLAGTRPDLSGPALRAALARGSRRRADGVATLDAGAALDSVPPRARGAAGDAPPRDPPRPPRPRDPELARSARLRSDPRLRGEGGGPPGRRRPRGATARRRAPRSRCACAARP